MYFTTSEYFVEEHKKLKQCKIKLNTEIGDDDFKET